MFELLHTYIDANALCIRYQYVRPTTYTVHCTMYNIHKWQWNGHVSHPFYHLSFSLLCDFVPNRLCIHIISEVYSVIHYSVWVICITYYQITIYHNWLPLISTNYSINDILKCTYIVLTYSATLHSYIIHTNSNGGTGVSAFISFLSFHLFVVIVPLTKCNDVAIRFTCSFSPVEIDKLIKRYTVWMCMY